MNKNYWAVQGYGIKVEESMFDVNKLRPLTDLNEEEYVQLIREDDGVSLFEDGFIEDVLDNLSPVLQRGDTGNLQLGTYLLYPFKAPWLLSAEEKDLTEVEILDIIEEVLLPYLKDEYNRKWLEQTIGYISLGGGF